MQISDYVKPAKHVSRVAIFDRCAICSNYLVAAIQSFRMPKTKSMSQLMGGRSQCQRTADPTILSADRGHSAIAAADVRKNVHQFVVGRNVYTRRGRRLFR